MIGSKYIFKTLHWAIHLSYNCACIVLYLEHVVELRLLQLLIDVELVLDVQELLKYSCLLSFSHFVHFHQDCVEFLVQAENFKFVLRTDVIDLNFDFLSSYLHISFVFLLLTLTNCLLDTFRLGVATHSKLWNQFSLTYFFCFESTYSIFLKLSKSEDGLNLADIVASR